MSRLVLVTWEKPLSKLWFYAWLQIYESGKMMMVGWSGPGSSSSDHFHQSQYHQCHQYHQLETLSSQFCIHFENFLDCCYCYYWWEFLWWSLGHHCWHSSGSYWASKGRNISQADIYFDWKTQDCYTHTWKKKFSMKYCLQLLNMWAVKPEGTLFGFVLLSKKL